MLKITWIIPIAQKCSLLVKKNRMRSALNSNVGGRSNIWKSSNLAFTGVSSPATVCEVDIDVERNLVCRNDLIQFYDNSYNNITSWNWSFPGGNPSTSTNKDPVISYNSSGTFNVVLEVTDEVGNTMSKSFSDYITVMGNSGSGIPFNESFENVSSLPDDNWTISNLSGPGFQVVSNIAASGSKCVKLDNSSGTVDDVDELISAPLNLSNLTSASISFKYAFAKRYNSNSDYLKIYASFNCGEVWMLRKNITSISLPTHPNTTSPYTPNSDSWATVNVPGISSAYLVDNFRLKFEFHNGGGNDLFIDDININGIVSVSENEVIRDFALYPNPANDLVKLSFNANSIIEDAKILMFDAFGRLVKEITTNEFKKGNQEIVFSIADLEKGWYFIQLNSSQINRTLKLIKN
jgi:PKD repeat protein